MSNPLNEQVAQLLVEISKLEADRERQLRTMEGLGLLGIIAPELRQRHITYFQNLDDLTRKIDFDRQKLISLELLLLDNSMKSLQSTTGQVEVSVKSLGATTDRVLKSPSELERLTTNLIYVTVLLAVIALFTLSVDISVTNPTAGFFGAVGSAVAIVYLFAKVFSFMSRKPQ